MLYPEWRIPFLFIRFQRNSSSSIRVQRKHFNSSQCRQTISSGDRNEKTSYFPYVDWNSSIHHSANYKQFILICDIMSALLVTNVWLFFIHELNVFSFFLSSLCSSVRFAHSLSFSLSRYCFLFSNVVCNFDNSKNITTYRRVQP